MIDNILHNSKKCSTMNCFNWKWNIAFKNTLRKDTRIHTDFGWELTFVSMFFLYNLHDHIISLISEIENIKLV